MRDTLSDVLRAVRLTGAVFFAIDASAPWVAETPGARLLAPRLMPGVEHVVEYHLITAGSCWAGLIDEPAFRLEAGDIIVFPQGDAHVVSSTPGMRGDPSSDVHRLAEFGPLPISVSIQGGGDERAQIICGFLGCLLFVEAVRHHVATLPAEQVGWFAGLRDDQIGRALAKLHQRPAHAWTLDELAKEVAMSRSMLAERFMHFVGIPPIQYLAQWRIQLAASLLRTSRSNLAEIAERVGYGSEAALSRAFKRTVGTRRRRIGAATARDIAPSALMQWEQREIGGAHTTCVFAYSGKGINRRGG